MSIQSIYNAANKETNRIKKAINQDEFIMPEIDYKIEAQKAKYAELKKLADQLAGQYIHAEYVLECLKKRKKYAKWKFTPKTEVNRNKDVHAHQLFSTFEDRFELKTLNRSNYEPDTASGCRWCKQPIIFYKYFDYSDSRYDTKKTMCDCVGARTHGIPWDKVTNN